MNLKRKLKRHNKGPATQYEREVMKDLAKYKTPLEKARFCLAFARRISDLRLEAYKEAQKNYEESS